MADELLEQAQLLQKAKQIQAQKTANVDPNQPGVQAIGSNGTPGQEPDWVDKIKSFASKIHQGMAQDMLKYNQENFNSATNPLQDSYEAASKVLGPISRVAAYPLQWGDRAEDLGVPGLDRGIPVPFTNDKKVTAKQIANLAGNTVGAELGARAVGFGGEKIYKSAFKKIDEKMLEKGKTPFSEVMRENGMPAGSMEKIKETAKNLKNEKMAERGAAYDKATDKAVTVDPDYPAPEAEAVLEKMRRDPNLREQADALQAHLDNYRKEGKVSLEQMSEWKSNLANSLPKSAYDGNGRPGPWAQQYKKALASDYRNAVVEGGDVAEAGMGQKIDKLNDEIGTLIEAEKPAKKQIGRENTHNAISSVDAPLLYLKFKAGLLKKAADIAKLTSARTYAGKGMVQAAPHLGPALRTNAIGNSINPWSNNGKEE